MCHCRFVTKDRTTINRVGAWLRRRWLLSVAGLLGLIALGSPQHYRDDLHSANEASRIYATLAIVDHGTLHLDPVFDRFFQGWQKRKRPPNTDVCLRNGHYYTDKAPGITLLAVPVVATLRLFGVKLRYAQLAWLLSLLLAALPSLLFGGMLWRWLRQTFGHDSPATLVAPALVLASPWLIFCAQLFGHALAASLVGAGLLFALGPLRPLRKDTAAGENTRRDSILGGLCLGGATLAEYPAGVLAVLVCLAVAVDPHRRQRLPWIVLGGLGPALVLLGWNTLAFGGPLSFSYGHTANPAFAEVYDKGFYGISLPGADALWGLGLSPRRGLLFLAPWLALGLAGIIWGATDSRLTRAWRVLLPLGFGASLLMIAGFAFWHGGRTLGPRYLLFTLPLVGVGAALAVERLWRWRFGGIALAATAGLALSSLALSLAGHLGFPHVSHRIRNPLFEVVLPVWFEGGPGPTAWGGLLPGAGGALLTVLATLGLLALAVITVRRTRHPADPPSAPAGPPSPGGRWLAPLVLVGVALLHLALGTLPTTAGHRGRRRVLKERAFAHEVLNQPAAARRVLRARRRLSRRR